ncbi:MAG: HEAT repeat domain-containing protein [Marinifilaceae bacterium]
MKSKQEQLINRGFLDEGVEENHLDLSYEARVELLRSQVPIDRTLGARLLAQLQDKRAVAFLVEALAKERKLYSRLEICNSLVAFGRFSIQPLIALLGKVGNNQHKYVPEKEFKKISYPLPRDIAARTLIRLGRMALPELLEVLEIENTKQVSEAIDAIGFICFYDPQPEHLANLQECYTRYYENNLIRWKIIRALSAFPNAQSFLQEQKQSLTEIRLQKEIDRSLTLIGKK